jgi:hypothetical protein
MPDDRTKQGTVKLAEAGIASTDIIPSMATYFCMLRFRAIAKACNGARNANSILTSGVLIC